MTAPIFHLLPGIPRPISPSSHATEANGFVFITGQLGRDLDDPDAALPEGIVAQTERTLSNVMRVLGALRVQPHDIVAMRVYLSDFARDYEQMNAVYARYFTSQARPARTCIGVTALARNALVEMDCIAARSVS